ncbi:MAG: 16S rRNA (cytidine(1402)-2'-O)-methyltransferase [Nitriliruptoraceae bacterium]|nr:16S rRNA (cytidine(1402)-2'-O)-methyltransferase [Nitriliruptoraceae bacterium]
MDEQPTSSTPPSGSPAPVASTAAPASGVLQVVATPIGNLDDLSLRAARTLREADLVLAEDTRRTGKLLAHVEATAPQRSLHEHNERERIPEVLDLLHAGQRVVLVSDAGTPAVSDPGYRLLAACAEAGVRIEPIPGPSAVLAALVASGLPTDRVVFDGFLPRRGSARRQRLASIAQEPRTVVLFAAPHRTAEDLHDLAQACGPDRRAVWCRELTKLHEEVRRGSLAELAEAAGLERLRGEVTLVVAGAVGSSDAATPPDVADLVARVDALVAEGTRMKDAAAQVAAATDTSTRALYQAVLDARSAARER